MTWASVRAAEECPVDPAAHPAMHLEPAPQHHRAEHRPERDAVRLFVRPQVPREPGGEEQRQADAHQRQQERKAALHEQVTRAAPQQHRDLEHAVLDHGVGERDGHREDEQRHQQREGRRRAVRREGLEGDGGERRQDADERPPEDHPRLPPHFSVRGAPVAGDQSREAQPEAPENEDDGHLARERVAGGGHHARQPQPAVWDSRQGKREADDRDRPLQPGPPPIERRPRREHREEEIEERADQPERDCGVHESEGSQGRFDPGVPVGQARRGDEAGEQQGQQPGVPVFDAQEEDRQADDHEGQRVEIVNLPGHLLDHGSPRNGAERRADVHRLRLTGAHDREAHGLTRPVAGPGTVDGVLADERQAVDGGDPVPHPQAGALGGAAGGHRVDALRAGAAVVRRVEAYFDRGRGLRADLEHPHHAGEHGHGGEDRREQDEDRAGQAGRAERDEVNHLSRSNIRLNLTTKDRSCPFGLPHEVVEVARVVVDDEEAGVGGLEPAEAQVHRPEVGAVVVLDERLQEGARGEREGDAQAGQVGGEIALRGAGRRCGCTTVPR